MERLFKEVEEWCLRASFIETVIEKAHYSSEDRELLWSVLEKILACMADGAAVSDKAASGGAEAETDKPRGAETETDKACGMEAETDKACGMEAETGKPHMAEAETGKPRGAENAEGETCAPNKAVREVVMTLGKGVDELQEQFLADGLLTEAYMVEVLGSEILLLAYAAYNAWVKEHTDAVVKRYYFLGTDTSLRIEAIPGMLERSGLPVSCTEGYCMIPKKSVVFYAELTRDKTVTCEGICMGCGRNDCPNRMSAGDRQLGNRALDRPLTYGYSRILGL